MEEVFTFKNLYDAYLYTRKGKRDKKCVIEYEINALENSLRLSEALISEAYRLGEFDEFYVYEPKKRLIMAPPFDDRVVQRCLCKQVLEERIERHLIYDTYACRVGKGTHKGLYRLEEFMRKYYRKNGLDGWIVKGDISKYFYSIHHYILKDKMYPLLKDLGLEWLFDEIIDSTSDPGIPLGNQSSQWFANLYMSFFDHFVKEVLRVKYYIRYMDDFVAIVESREEAREVLKRMKEFLWDELKLETNKKTQIFPLKNGVDFLGFHTYITKSGKVIRKIRRASKERMRRKLKAYKVKYRSGEMTKDEIVESYESWKAHARYGNCYRLIQRMDKLYDEIFEGDG